jgi:hypothetical protein
MDLARVLRWEVSGFVYGLAALIAFRMLTGQINLRNLLRRKDGGRKVSPERVQLLLTTIFLSVSYLKDALHSSGNALPDVSPQMLYVFGASRAIYGSVKAWTNLKVG